MPREAKPFPGKQSRRTPWRRHLRSPRRLGASRDLDLRVLLCEDCASLCGPLFTGEPGSPEAGPRETPAVDPPSSAHRTRTRRGMAQLGLCILTRRRGSREEVAGSSVLQSGPCVDDLAGLCNGRGSGRLAARNRRPWSPGGSPPAGVAQAAQSQAAPPAGPSPLGLPHWPSSQGDLTKPSPSPLPVSPNLPPKAEQGPGLRGALGWIPAVPPLPQVCDQDPPSSVQGDPPRAPDPSTLGRSHVVTAGPLGRGAAP